MLSVIVVICSLIVPIIMLIYGFIFKNSGPKDINGNYGYRTAMSMKNKDTWDFAHVYSARLWRFLGIVLFIFSVIIITWACSLKDDTPGVVLILLITIQTIALVISIYPVEKALKKNFDSNGHRRLNQM